MYPLNGGYRSIGMKLKPIGPGDTRRVRLKSGPFIFVNTGEHLGNIIYWMGDSDPRITRLCRTLLGKGETGLDIGTNNGVEALTMADAVGPEGRVVACEANPSYRDNLVQSREANRFKQLDLRQVAVTDHDGEITFDPTGVTGKISDAGITVPAVDAEKLFAELAPIGLVKLDVEGHEATILKAARQAIRDCPPKHILFESHPGQPFWSREEVVVLKELGYRFHHITRSLLGSFLKPIAPGDHIGPGFDFLATHERADSGRK